MVPAILLSRAILSAVFLPAAISKLRDRQTSRQSLHDFGLPTPLAAPGAILLPLAELLIAIGLLPRSFAWISATAAAALLTLFILAISINLARGRKPNCNCFGQLHSKPIGWSLAARDAALAAIAALVIQAGPRQPSFITALSTAGTPGGPVFLAIAIAALVILIVQSFLIYQLIQQGGRVLLRLDAIEKAPAAPQTPPAPPGLPVGDPAPAFELPDLAGAPVSLERLRSAGKPVLLLFLHPTCGPCADLLPEAAAWQRDSSAHFTLALLSQGTADENRAKIASHAIQPLLLQHEHEISTQYDALGTPSAVLVRPDGVIGSPVATGAEAIRSLVANTINESVAGLVAIQLTEGAAAPPLVFPDLDGRMFNLSQLRGKPSILLFWNPGCGFCQQMAPNLKSWEKKAAKAGTQVVLLSRGPVDENRKQGFRSPILLDPDFSAGKSFGATGTPSAVLLDPQTRIVSKVAVGQKEILDSIFTATASKES